MSLLERNAELAASAETLRLARFGAGSLLIVGGGLGIGRSALLRAMAVQAADDCRVLHAEGAMLERDFDLGIARQLLQPLLLSAGSERSANWCAGAAAPVRLLFPSDGPGQPLPWHVVLPALTAFVVNLSQEQPVALLIDDLQWADSSSLRWLGYLARRLDRLPVAVLVGLADGVAVPEPALVSEIVACSSRTLYPAPLSKTAVIRLAESVHGEAGEPEFAAMVHRVTRANPAALDVVLRGLAPRADRDEKVEEIEQEGQLLLRDRRMYCLNLQPAGVQALARSMAVLDRETETGGPGPMGDADLLTALAGLTPGEYQAANRALCGLDLLPAGGYSGFVHPSLPEMILSTIPVAERESLHRRAAKLLHENGFPVGQVAEQLMVITSGYTGWETEMLRDAADAALERGAGRSAARYLRAVLFDTAPDSTLRGRLLVDLAVAERGFDLLATVRHLTQALLVLTSMPERAEAVLWIPPGAATSCPSVTQTLRQADIELGVNRSDGPQQELALRLEARIRYLGDRLPAALDDSVNRLASADVDTLLGSAGGRELLASLLHCAGVTAAIPADTLARLGARLLEHEAPGTAHAYGTLPTLVSLLAAADQPEIADEWIAEALRQARQEESAEVLALVMAERGMLLAARGRLAEAAALAGAALDQTEWEDAIWPDAIVMAMCTLTTVALATNDPRICERVLRAVPISGDLRVIAASRMARGVRDLNRGDLTAALDRFLDCGRQLAQAGWQNTALMPWRLAAATAQWLLDRPAEAAELAEREHHWALAWGSPASLGRSLGLRAALTGGNEGISLRRQAVDVLAGSADRLAYSRASMALGLNLAQLRSPEAQTFLAEGARSAVECGASWSVDHPDHAAASAAGGPDQFWAPDIDGLTLRLTTVSRVELTRSEEAVADLVRQRWTNQRIADALGVTRRAVEKTLTGAYRKFAVQGRAGLVAALEARDLIG